MVLSKLRAVMGGRLRFAVTGSAPTPEALLRFFDALGLRVFEAYGMSECIVPVALNTPGHFSLGTVGRPLAVNQLRLDEDNELLIKGPGVFSGYYDEPDRPDLFTSEGYYRTGDYAEIDLDGYLRLRGRKSEIFKTSTGRRISPIGIEATLQELPYVDRALVLGAGRKCLAAILTLDRETIHQSDPDRPQPHEALEQRLAADLAATIRRLPEHERPAGYLVLGKSFSLERGEITPNLKLRRRSIEELYAAQIDDLFDRIERQQDTTPVLLMA
jgi:long-chain acyl-CoA synthetase